MSNKVLINNSQKAVKVRPVRLRILDIRRACSFF